MSKRGDSRKGKKPEPEEPAEEEKPVVTIEEPPGPFERLKEVWTLEPLEQRKLIGDLLMLTDGPDHSMQAMVLDQAVSHLAFARGVAMNGAQTKQFYSIMEDVLARCKEEQELGENFAQFKSALMNNSDLKKTMAQIIAEEKAAIEASRPPTAEPDPEPEEKGKKKSDKSKGKKKVEEVVEQVEAPPPTPPKPRENCLFTQAMVLAICKYASEGIFGHYTLHRCVFNPKLFTPRTKLVHQHVTIQTIVPDGLKLSLAVDLDEVKAKEHAEEKIRLKQERLEAEANSPDSQMAKLVDARLKEARERMMEVLAAKEKELRDKLEAAK